MDYCHLLGALLAGQSCANRSHNRRLDKTEEQRFYELHGKTMWLASSLERVSQLVVQLFGRRAG